MTRNHGNTESEYEFQEQEGNFYIHKTFGFLLEKSLRIQQRRKTSI